MFLIPSTKIDFKSQLKSKANDDNIANLCAVSIPSISKLGSASA